MRADLFILMVVISGINTAIFYILQKYNTIDSLKEDVNSSKYATTKILQLFFGLLSCEFCMFFWMAIVELFYLYITRCDFHVFGLIMIVPFSLFCAALSKFFLRSNH